MVVPVPGESAAVRVVTLPAELDDGSGAGVVTALTEGLAKGAAVIADLAATTYCSLEGLAALLAAAAPEVAKVLERTGVSRVLALYPSVQAAHDGPGPR